MTNHESPRQKAAQDYDWVQKEVVRLYVEEEWSTRDIASEFGIDKSTVSVWLRKQGVEIRPPSKVTTSKHREKLASRDISYLNAPEVVEKWASKRRGKPVPHLNTPEVLDKRNATYTSERHSEVLKKNWQDPDYRAKMSAARSKQAKERWAKGNWRNSTRNSKIEYQIAPILAKEGYVHNTDAALVIASTKKARIPDFYDESTKRVVEIWGTYWHKDEKPETLVRWYKNQGWSCSVIWEDEALKVVESLGKC